MATVGEALLVSVTSSKLAQEPLLMVHTSVTLLPGTNPVTVVVGEFMLVIDAPLAGPEMLHVPLPTLAAFPASLKVPLLHCS